jgi:hypothetical protein
MNLEPHVTNMINPYESKVGKIITLLLCILQIRSVNQDFLKLYIYILLDK